jgi:hypothetical protein
MTCLLLEKPNIRGLHSRMQLLLHIQFLFSLLISFISFIFSQIVVQAENIKSESVAIIRG